MFTKSPLGKSIGEHKAFLLGQQVDGKFAVITLFFRYQRIIGKFETKSTSAGMQRPSDLHFILKALPVHQVEERSIILKAMIFHVPTYLKWLIIVSLFWNGALAKEKYIDYLMG